MERDNVFTGDDSMSYGYDINAEKWFSCWKINPLANPDYYETLFRYFKSLCAGMKRVDLIIELDRLIEEKVESPMGSPLSAVLWVYKNLPALNSFTKSNNLDYVNEYVRKYELKTWLDEVEGWVFDRLVELEPQIRFKDTQKLL